MRSVKRVADRIPAESRQIFINVGYAILKAEKKDEIETLFNVMGGQGQLSEVSKFLPQTKQIKEYMKNHEPDHWSTCEHWSKWWMRPRHLSKYMYKYISMMIL